MGKPNRTLTKVPPDHVKGTFCQPETRRRSALTPQISTDGQRSPRPVFFFFQLSLQSGAVSGLWLQRKRRMAERGLVPKGKGALTWKGTPKYLAPVWFPKPTPSHNTYPRASHVRPNTEKPHSPKGIPETPRISQA